ncbi:hypothetical protein GW17_00002288 [Ensete ventricosum]|uniref:Uncharacterized protein n=1 Tax=Ensete ventricosum TaxID=4639 RepID=A0A426YGQ1_ENSVE|nr:hypothetical protein B296_00036420 [Ensete ventricosum]RWW33005.1 hypothetical protein GW17_00002288 [Ensete ventricosum]
MQSPFSIPIWRSPPSTIPIQAVTTRRRLEQWKGGLLHRLIANVWLLLHRVLR